MKLFEMRLFYFFLILITFTTCKQVPQVQIPQWVPYDQSGEIANNSDHEKSRMRFKLIQSKFSDKNDLWSIIAPQISDFSEEEYETLKPIILEANILSLQEKIKNKQLTYKKLTQWYLYRILKFENDKDLALHTIITINKNAVDQAIERDKENKPTHPIFGMPILLKDNINTQDMPTTAGASVLSDNNSTNNAFIVSRIIKHGGIILGKANLSEWAYFFCSGCPLGYSAVGGQTLNPYGRKKFETGGSSAGSGVAIAANYAVAAIGTETSGSILSPSSQNSIVGIKPTIGLLSRSGIVPISSTLDTPGPMTRNVSDAAILLSAMRGFDTNDSTTFKQPKKVNYLSNTSNLGDLKGYKFGAFNSLVQSDSLYKRSVNNLKSLNAEIVLIDGPETELNGFLTLLNIDMKHDLPKYLETHYKGQNNVSGIVDIMNYNLKDSTLHMPYGQTLFEGIANDSTTLNELESIKMNLQNNGRYYFDSNMDKFNLNGILSVNNYHAGFAAVAKYPCLTLPMGYRENGEPTNLTLIAKPYEEEKLINWAAVYEREFQVRKLPEQFQ